MSESLVPKNFYVLLLCTAQRQPLYEPILQRCGPDLRVVNDAWEAFTLCVTSPPAALIIDLLGSDTLGRELVETLSELQVSWPVMRSTPEGEFVRVMWSEGSKRCLLEECLQALRAGDPSWKHPRFHRNTLRLDTDGRLLIRAADADPWLESNLLNISLGGLFAITYHPWQRNADIQIEIRDLSPTPITVAGKVVFARSWSSGPSVPGVGVAINPGPSTDHLKTLLSNPQLIKRFWASFQG